MKDKFFNVIVSIIAICLLYIAFLKPVPQRYVISTQTSETKTVKASYFTTDTTVFDTATANEYSLHSLQALNLEDGTSKTELSYLIRNLVERKIIHKDTDKNFNITGWEK